MRIDWDRNSLNNLDRNILNHKSRVLMAVEWVATYWSAVFEADAKEQARWTDRTGHARQRLFTLIETLANDTVALYLAHGVEYGKYLEQKNAGRYSIIWPTIEMHLDAIRRMLDGIFR